MIGLRSPAAPIVISSQRGELVQVQDVDASVSCWIFQKWLQQHATGSPFCACLCCGVMSWVFTNCAQFRLCGCVHACTYRSLRRFFSSICTIFEIMFQFFFRKWCLASMNSVLSWLRCIVSPLVFVCHCKTLERIITCALFLSAFFLLR